MKYLKTYKLFESIDANIKSDIEDIALELADCEIYYEISDRKYWKNSITPEESLIIYLKDNQNRFFTIKDIEDVLLRMKDYLKTTDYSIDLSIPDSDDYLTFDEFIEEFSGEELYHVNIIIYYNPRISSFQRKYSAHEDFYESKITDNEEEFYKDLTDKIFYDINEYFIEEKKRFLPLKVLLGKNSDNSYYGSVCMGPGWSGRINDEDEDWLFDLLRSYRKEFGVSYDACADSFSHSYIYERKNKAWDDGTNYMNIPPYAFPERLN